MTKNKKSKLKKHQLKRLRIEALGALIINGNLKNFLDGKIYQGPLKMACLPVLNCYSCPGAFTSCPIGSLQSISNDNKFHISYYVVGLLFLSGILLGRWFCGWLCPFGFIQELLHKIPFKKLKINAKRDKYFRQLKFVFLFVFVLFIPIFIADQFGIGYPAFCKFICPAGTLEAGIPLILRNPALQKSIGFLFNWKVLLLTLTIIGSILIFRFFCKYTCPLGAILGLFNKISIYHLECSDACIDCGACSKICKMNISPNEVPNSIECIRCGDCVQVCPVNALEFKFELNKKGQNESES